MLDCLAYCILITLMAMMVEESLCGKNKIERKKKKKKGLKYESVNQKFASHSFRLSV
jgi:hypothetical protein